MKLIIALAAFLTGFAKIQAQTPEDFICEIRSNCTSTYDLKKVIQKHASFRDYQNWSHSDDTITYLYHKKLFECYRFKTPRANGDTANKLVFLYVTYKDDQVGYVKIDASYYDYDLNKFFSPVLYKYIDSAYSASILAVYNTKHNTDFTWQDLFEDDLDRFCVDVGLSTPHPDDFDSTGFPTPYFGLSYQIKQCLPLILNKDHKTIIRYCKSFNPTRKAYGAVCLFSIQKMGEPLTVEEKKLLRSIKKSSETSDYSSGCFVTRDKKLKKFLTTEELESVYRTALRVQKYKKEGTVDY